MSLNIGLVARALNTDHLRGMGKYLYGLLNEAQSTDLRWHLFGDDPRANMLAPTSDRIVKDVFAFRGDRLQAWEQLGLPMRARRLNLDLIHAAEGALPLWQPHPVVVNVHDTCAWEERPDTPGARLYWDVVQPAALRRAAAVITSSESARNDILERWPWLENRLSVIPHGIDPEYFIDEKSRLPASLIDQLQGAPYAMYLGGAMARKRADWAIEVLGASGQADLKLVMCGFGSRARHDAVARLSPEMQGRVIYADFLSDPEMRALYRGAVALLYPTLYEGFGFPAVEAQAAGTPAIFSPLGSLAELDGPLASLVPPHDMQAWVAALAKARLGGPDLEERARSASLWARRFTWSESFAAHLAVYRTVAAQAVTSSARAEGSHS